MNVMGSLSASMSDVEVFSLIVREETLYMLIQSLYQHILQANPPSSSTHRVASEASRGFHDDAVQLLRVFTCGPTQQRSCMTT